MLFDICVVDTDNQSYHDKLVTMEPQVTTVYLVLGQVKHVSVTEVYSETC